MKRFGYLFDEEQSKRISIHAVNGTGNPDDSNGSDNSPRNSQTMRQNSTVRFSQDLKQSPRGAAR